MASEKLLKLLNDAVARELQVAIQYMWQHVRARGILGELVSDTFEKIAITEMKHAEAIAERVDYLGGVPTTQPADIHVGESLLEMVDRDIKDEENAIKLYKEIVHLAESEDDITTKTLFEKILADEEDHHDTFLRIREDLKQILKE